MDGISGARLEVFLSVAEAGSFSAAAREMHVSQPALSRAVMELERRLGARLFDRVQGGVQLTPEGWELRTISQEILRAHRDGLARFEAFVARRQEKLVVAALPSLAASYLPRIVSEYRTTHRGVTVHVHDGARDWIEQAVLSGSADLGLTGCAETAGTVLAEEIWRDAFHAVLRPDDELCGKEVPLRSPRLCNGPSPGRRTTRWRRRCHSAWHCWWS